MASVTDNRRRVLDLLARALSQSSDVLQAHPDNLFPLFWNKLQWRSGDVEELNAILARGRAAQARPWLRALVRLAESPELLRTVKHSLRILHNVAFVPNSDRIISFDGSLFHLWSIASGLEEATIPFPSGDRMDRYDIAPDGRRLVAGIGQSNASAAPALFDVDRLEKMRDLADQPNQMTACAFSRDGAAFVTGTRDGVILVWDSASGRQTGRCVRHKGGINKLVFSPAGEFFLSAGEDKTLRLWDAPTRRWLATLVGHSSEVSVCAFSGDGGRIVSAAGRELFLWDVGEGRVQPTLRLKEHERIADCLFKPGDECILVVSYNCWATRDADTGNRLEQFRAGTFYRAVSPDGTLAATNYYWDETIDLRDLRTGESIAILRAHHDDVNCLDFSADSRFLLSVSDDETIRLWDAKSPSRPHAYTGHRVGVGALAFHPSGEFLISGGWDGAVRGWTMPDVREEFATKLSEDHISELMVSTDGRHILTRLQDDDRAQVRLLCAQPFHELVALSEPEEWTRGVALRPDGRIAVVVIGGRHDEEGPEPNTSRLRVWDVIERRRLLEVEREISDLKRLELSPDGRWLFLTNRKVEVWETSEWMRAASLDGFQAGFAPSSDALFTTCFGGLMVYALDGNNWTRVAQVYKPGPARDGAEWEIAVSPDGRHVVTWDSWSWAGTGCTMLWDADACRFLALLEGRPVSHCAFSPDGSLLMTGDADGYIALWVAESGRLLCRNHVGLGFITTIAFSPDGHRLAAGDALGHIQLLDPQLLGGSRR